MKIFLIGFMGCGKTRMGKSISSKAGKPFIDLDTLIEHTQHLSIPELFALKGENGFRAIERDTLQHAAFADDAIISTEWMNKNGLTIFIDPPVKVLADRLIKAKTERPLVKNKSFDELLVFIEEKLAERRPFYEQAQIVLKGANLGSEDFFNALAEKEIKF
jgi:shikimate kinase